MIEPELAEVIEVIADKLGIVATELVGIFSEAQVGIGVMRIIQVTLFFGLLAFIMVKTTKALDSDKYKDWSEDDKIGVGLMVCLASICILLICILEIGDSILHIMYPEYFGIKDLISSFASI